MSRTTIIAEAGVNHNGSLETALRLAEAAAECGADIVKFQSFHASNVVSRHAPKAEYQQHDTNSLSHFEMLRNLEIGDGSFAVIREHCRSIGLEFLSTPFDLESIRLLQRLGVNRFKLGSGEITNAPLLLAAARTGKSIILSTGMSTLEEIQLALGVLAIGYSTEIERPTPKDIECVYSSEDGQKALRSKVTLLHCTSEYPAPAEDVNLNAMQTMREAFGLSVGLSDHTSGIHIAIAAVALGACIIEKHFTLDRNSNGPDHRASIEPHELRAMIESVREVELALGSGEKKVAKSESKNVVIARRSLMTATPVRNGEIFTEENLKAKRPGTGVSPMEYWGRLGTQATRDYEAEEMID